MDFTLAQKPLQLLSNPDLPLSGGGVLNQLTQKVFLEVAVSNVLKSTRTLYSSSRPHFIKGATTCGGNCLPGTCTSSVPGCSLPVGVGRGIIGSVPDSSWCRTFRENSLC